MSDAVLAFHSQLSVVMETVLKAAVFEITRLVEVSFVEEMTQSRQEVEALKQRLQRSERRLMAREGERGARCQDCGKAAVSREAPEKAGQRTHSGVEDGCDVKEEKLAKGNRGSCVWEVLDSSPGVSRETAASRFSRTTDTIDLEEEGIDQLHDTEDVKEVTSNAGLQGRLGACLGGTLAAGVALTEEGEAGGTGASPPLSLSLQERDRQGLRGHSCRPKPQSQHTALTPRPAGPLEPAAKRLGLPGSDRTLMDSVTVQQAAFTREPSSPAEGVGSTCSSFGFLSVKAEAGLSESVSLKEEAELLAVCGEDGGSSTVHRQFGEETVPVYVPCVVPLQTGVVRALQSQDTLHSLPGRGGGAMTVGEGEGGVLHSDAPDENECNLSDGGFTLADGTEVHPREHAEERSFSCLHCGKSFSQLRNLKDHQRYHTGNKTHSCAHCGKGFVYMCHLKVHMQSHTGERPYSCTQCGKTFTYLCNLKSHQQYHTGEKPFSCTLCGKSFRHLSHLKKHRFMHTGERPYRCSDCGKRFAASGDLKRHQRIHTR